MTRRPLRVLSVKQPWAHMIITGAKDVENRSWDTTYRGWLGIHASTRLDTPAARDMITYLGWDLPPDSELDQGAILGVAFMLGTTRTSPSPWAVAGQVHWQLRGARALITPIACPGKLGLWTPTPEIETVLRHLTQKAA